MTHCGHTAERAETHNDDTNEWDVAELWIFQIGILFFIEWIVANGQEGESIGTQNGAA